jgi:CubicO group peptidase (beta-lactamase class C family)
MLRLSVVVSAARASSAAARVGLLLVVLAAVCSSAAQAGGPVVSDVPPIDGITVDGDPTDWGDRGFHIELLVSDDISMRPPDDLDAECRLGWNSDGLLVLVSVLDDTPYESRSAKELWEHDSIELFVAADRETAAHAQFIVSPGLDPEYPDTRIQPGDQRADKSEEMTADIEVREQEGGYVLEMFFPWSNLQLAPTGGEEIGFQVFVNDSDGPDDRFSVIWHPRMRSDGGSRASHIVCLAEEAGPPVRIAARGSYERFRRIRVDVAAVAELAGESVELCEGTCAVASAELAEKEGRVSAKLVVPLPPRGEPLPEVAVCLDDEVVVPCELPDIEQARARELIEGMPFHFRPYVFGGTNFPSCDFERPNLAEDMIGSYTVERTFYDQHYNEVDSADEPGRYGAVVKIVPEQGKLLTLYRTLFRMPESYELKWFPRYSGLQVALPPMKGFDPRIAERQADAINDVFWMLFRFNFDREPSIAALAASLAETTPEGPKTTVANDFFAQDRQWWVGLKRKLYEMDEAYPEAFECPRPKEGDPAPVLREGTLEEAGADPEGVEKIDALLKEWAADSGEGFAVCLARHGVVFLHKAYGERDGRPMTLTDKSWNASITKLLSATLTMTLVDQGRVELDDTVDKFLPPFRGVEVETPITIRHLYTHTAGLWGHWGDELHDFDQLIGYYYPHLDVGKRFEYNGAGYSIAGKIIEMASGEAIPQFYKRHLLDPLGCENLDVFGNSWDSRAAPMDLAKIGQMLLNRGAYGDMRFFSEDTFAQMMPDKLTKVLGSDKTSEVGIGCYWMSEKEFGKQTFGHGAASSADLLISPEKDMVVVMTRNMAGKNFGKYHQKFLEAVAEAVE